MGNLTIWLTPIWVLSLGVTAGDGYAARGVWHSVAEFRAARPRPRCGLVRESVLQWVSYVVAGSGRVLLAGDPRHAGEARSCIRSSGCRMLAPVRRPRYPFRRARTISKCRCDFESDELQSYSFASEQDLIVGVEKGKAYSNPLILVEGQRALHVDAQQQDAAAIQRPG